MENWGIWFDGHWDQKEWDGGSLGKIRLIGTMTKYME